jgi:hypothetical protein
MKSFLTTILICLNFLIGFSQNSTLTIVESNKILKNVELDLVVITKDGFFKINKSEKLLYNEYNFKNAEIISVCLIQKQDTLIFFAKKNQKLIFEKNSSGYKSLQLSFNSKNEKASNFDFELCKKNELDIIINLNDIDFKRVYCELIIGMENPNGKYDKEVTSKYNIRKYKREFRKRKKELRKHFKETDFATLIFDNNISIGENTCGNNAYQIFDK